MEDKKTTVFEEKTFKITETVRLTALVAYIDGHPIVKTKTIVLHYNGKTFSASDGKTAFTERLIKDVTDPVYVVELMNYLSMLINGNFLFEVYAKPPKQPSSLVEATFVNQGNDEVGGAPHFDEPDLSLYHEGLIKHRQFVNAPLMASMNKRFTRTFASIEELDYVPVYGYISASDSLSRMSEPVLHLAIVFNILAHQDRFSDINNQDAIASFNVIMNAERLGINAEVLNKKTFEYQAERKRFYKKALADEHDAHNETKRMHQELLKRFDETQSQNTILIQQNIDLKHDLATANELLDTLINMNVDDKGTVDDIRSDLDQAKDTLAQMKDGIAQVRNEVGSLAVKDQKMLKKDYLIIYRSNTKPAQAHVRERIEPGQIWLATFNGRLTSYKSPDIPIDATEIYRIESNRLDSYDYLMSKQQIKDLIIKEFQCSWLVAQANVEELINRIEAELNADNQFESVRHLEALAIHVDEQPIDEQQNPIVKRKEELINQFGLKLRVIVNGWKRRVYAKNESGELIDLESVPNPTNTRWYYRYGRGGANVAYIGKRSIQALNFTDQTDARITYE